ncbi:MAG TPA: hypothetical protein VIL53_02120 [Solirubrobacterales bacterium]
MKPWLDFALKASCVYSGITNLWPRPAPNALAVTVNAKTPPATPMASALFLT